MEGEGAAWALMVAVLVRRSLDLQRQLGGNQVHAEAIHTCQCGNAAGCGPAEVTGMGS